MKEIIEESGMSLKEFAKYYEIPYNTVRQWYNEEREAPKYIKKLIEENLNLKTKGQQLTIEENEDTDKRYFVKIIHIKTNTTIYRRCIDYQEYVEFETNYWYVEYIKNKTGYKVNYYILNRI